MKGLLHEKYFNMKRIVIRITSVLLVLTAMVSCYNQDVDFPNNEFTTIFFPYQYPVRTLILGDYVFDNSNDNEHRFQISATMGGVYENDKDILIQYVVDESLTDDLYLGTTKILPLPSAYYSLSNTSQIVIPKGKYHGTIDVQLTDAFFSDPAAVGPAGTTYVIPLRMISTSSDSLHSGETAEIDPDRRVPADWVSVPKDFTLFGINYVNEYHGNFLARGRSEVSDGGLVIETNVYRNPYVERDQVVSVRTNSRRTVLYSNRVVRNNTSGPGNFEMLITFDEDGNGTIAASDDSLFPVSGTAKFSKDTERWGGKSRHAIYLDYQVDDGTYTHTAKDTLVFRDKGISFQEYVPEVVE